MPTCGNCHQTGQTIEHIRSCYASKASVSTIAKPDAPLSVFAQQYLERRDYAPMALGTSDVPDSSYALDTPDGIYFYRVRTGKGRWAGFQFVDRLIGHPGDFLRVPVKGANRMATLKLIALDPKGAAIEFSRRFTVCAVCGSPLTDPESMERGLGPVCAERF